MYGHNKHLIQIPPPTLPIVANFREEISNVSCLKLSEVHKIAAVL